MDASEIEENIFAAGDAKLHGEICHILSAIICKVLEIFPDLEASRPRSKSGIQSLCSVHVAIEKAKNLLQHCSNCSKLYLAITGESVLIKFERARCALQDSLRRVEDIVPQAIGCQIMEIVAELEETRFTLDQTEKQAGDAVVQLLQKDRKINANSNDIEELEIFHQAAIQLGITSSRAALTERRALKKLIERARAEEDKRKESIIAYLLHLMRKYSKLFRSEVSDDTDSQGSAPCSPTVQATLEDSEGQGGNARAFEKQLSKFSSFNFKTIGVGSGSMPIPPEEFRCPISLQLMYDPVIISSGQTYERVCIEKWFNDGHNTCPKTQQQLSHLCLTPNYCVKGLIVSWCEQNGLPIPVAPPDSLDLHYRRLTLSENEATDSRSVIGSCKLKNIKAPLERSVMSEEDNDVEEEPKENEMGDLVSNAIQDVEVDVFSSYGNLLSILHKGNSVREQHNAVEKIRFLLKDDDEARTYMGVNGFVEGLVQFLRLAVEEGKENSQEVGAMALFNLAVNNYRNKGMLLSAGVIPLLEEMISTSAYESAAALFLNISCLDDAKPIIGSSRVVPFLVQLLKTDDHKTQCRADALHTLYNLSMYPRNIPFLLCAGIIDGLHSIISASTISAECGWAEKSIAVYVNLASSKSGKKEIISAPGLIGSIAAVLDTGEPPEQEQAVSCLLILCEGNQTCCHMVLQEGVIPALVAVSVNGTPKGREKAQKLLMLFREHRPREPSPTRQQRPENTDACIVTAEKKSLVKSTSKRKLGRSLSTMWKNKHFSVYQC